MWSQQGKFVFSIEEIDSKTFLDIKEVTLNKGFPSCESFIQDDFGNNLFLYTYAPEGEDAIAYPGLLPNSYDEAQSINVKVEIDPSGQFLDEVIIGIPTGTQSFTAPSCCIAPTHPIIKLECQSGSVIGFNYNMMTRSEWNQMNLDKAPAGDCLEIPCCGNLGCCDD